MHELIIGFVRRRREAEAVEAPHVTWNRATRAIYGQGIVPVMDAEGVVKWGRF